MTKITEKQPASNNKKTWVRGRPFKKGQSGNPKGRPVDPNRMAALDLLKLNAPDVVQKALDMVLCEEPSERILVALINKICPDTLKLETENPLLVLIEKAKSGQQAP
jgi:hypothetical protein